MHYEPQVSIFLMMVLVTSNQNCIIIQIRMIILFHIIYLIILFTQKKKKTVKEICEIFDLSAFQEMKPAGSVYSGPTLSVGKEQNVYAGVPYYNSYISLHASLKMSSRLSHVFQIISHSQ